MSTKSYYLLYLFIVVSSHALAILAEDILDYETLFSLHDTFWNAFLYPESTKQALSINSSLFSNDVIGRVDDSGTFLGQELNTEYVFGAFSGDTFNPTVKTLLGVPLSYKVLRFATNSNVVSSSEMVLFNSTWLNDVVPIEIDIWMAFNSLGAITQYDVSFRWFGWLFDNLMEEIQRDENGTKSFVSQTAGEICQVAAEYCQGDLQQYDSYDACQDYLVNQVRFGLAYDFGHNTVLCRNLHAKLLPLRPSIHCPHVGPSGGDMCVDERNYQETVLQPEFLEDPCAICL